MKSVHVLLLTLAVSLALAAPGLAQPYPPPNQAVLCASTAEPPGDSTDCSAAGFCPDADVTVSFENTTLATVQANADGEAAAQIRVPSGAPDGPATVTFEGLGADCETIQVLSLNFTVDSGLPRTGAEGVDRWAALAGGLIVIGGTMVLVARRRKVLAR